MRLSVYTLSRRNDPEFLYGYTYLPKLSYQRRLSKEQRGKARWCPDFPNIYAVEQGHPLSNQIL